VFSVLIEPKRKTTSAADAGVAKKAARPSRAVAADGILVRENILFPSSPSVVEFQLAAPVGRMGRVLDGVDPSFGGLIAGKPCLTQAPFKYGPPPAERNDDHHSLRQPGASSAPSGFEAMADDDEKRARARCGGRRPLAAAGCPQA
jgi:hypothetical protein